jgi:regulator of sigma E protease
MSILVAILGFNLLVIVHELGHFLFARAAGMRVEKFSIGFGPPILRMTGKTGTVYQWATFPIGGYVAVTGQAERAQADHADSYQSKSLLARAAMVSAGPLFNFGLAALLYIGLFGTTNAIYFEGAPEGTTMVLEAQEPAASAGLQPYDTIERIDGKFMQSRADVLRAVGKGKGRPIEIVVARPPAGTRPIWETQALNGQAGAPEGLQLSVPKAEADWPRVTLTITPRDTPAGPKLGVLLDYARFGFDGWGQSALYGARQVGAVSQKMLQGIAKAIKGEGEAKLGGPVKITEIGADTYKRGKAWFLSFLAFLSINLGLLNLLPLPALDGGRLVFLLIEAIARKPVSARTESYIHGFGMLLLLGLIVVVTASDVLSLF